MKSRIEEIASKKININGKVVKFLTKDEEENLKISRGTLNKKDIKIMQSHVSLSYELLNKRPDMFAAATPICGAGHPDWIINYAKKTALWIIHGSNDRVVHPYYSLRMINAIIDACGSPKVTLYNNVKHNSWLNIFNDNRFLPWIYRQELADN